MFVLWLLVPENNTPESNGLQKLLVPKVNNEGCKNGNLTIVCL